MKSQNWIKSPVGKTAKQRVLTMYVTLYILVITQLCIQILIQLKSSH